MQVTLNENGVEIQNTSSLQSLLEQNDFATQKGIAVALNNKVIPRANWSAQELKENDKILVITATKGG